jgi:cell division initiation protein
MPLTPVEIRHLELHRAWLRGYRKSTVDRLLSEIADSFEEVWRERADLADRLDELEAEASKHRELEALLRSTLVSAERAAHDMKEQARRESDLIVQEARAEGRRVVHEFAAEKQRLEQEVRKIRALLRTALESLGERAEETKAGAAEAEAPPVEQKPASVEEALDTGIRRVAG